MLRFIDGFDYYNTQALFLRKWDYVDNTVNLGLAYGRNGSGGMRPSGGSNGGDVGKNLPAANSGYGFFGTAIYVPNMVPGFSLVHGVYNPAVTPHNEIGSYILGDGSIGIGNHNNATLILQAQTGPGLISAANYRHIETGIRVHDVNGEVIVRLDGDVVLSWSGNTRRSGAATSNEFRHVRLFRNSGLNGEQWYDDFYYCDDTGPKNNDFLGDMRIITLYPNAVGDLSEWPTLVGAATIWEAINQHPTDDDTSYAASNTPGERFLVNLDMIAGVDGDVKGLAVNFMAKKDDAGTRKVAALVKVPSTGGAIGEATEQAFPAAYANLQYIFESNPDTLANFTWPQIGELQAGGKITL